MTTISSKGQITVPVEISAVLGLLRELDLTSV